MAEFVVCIIAVLCQKEKKILQRKSMLVNPRMQMEYAVNETVGEERNNLADILLL